MHSTDTVRARIRLVMAEQVGIWSDWVHHHLVLDRGKSVRNRMPVSLRGGGGELGNLKT
jgi:hypothetical protein